MCCSLAHVCRDDKGKRVLDAINQRMHALRASAGFLRGVGGRTDREWEGREDRGRKRGRAGNVRSCGEGWRMEIFFLWSFYDWMARRRHGVHRRNIADVMARVPNVFLMCSQKYSISCRHIECIAEVMACAPKVFLMCSQKYSLSSFST